MVVGEVNLDYFHLGLLLVIIMVFITGIVLCVAVAGVCCFHWLDGKNGDRDPTHQGGEPTGHKLPTPSQIREQIWRLDNELSQQLRRYEEIRVKRGHCDVPPPYADLFPHPHPPGQGQGQPLPTYEELAPISRPLPPTHTWRDNFTLFV